MSLSTLAVINMVSTEFNTVHTQVHGEYQECSANAVQKTKQNKDKRFSIWAQNWYRYSKKIVKIMMPQQVPLPSVSKKNTKHMSCWLILMNCVATPCRVGNSNFMFHNYGYFLFLLYLEIVVLIDLVSFSHHTY